MEFVLLLILIDLVLYLITKWRIFYWIACILIIGWLSAIAFAIGTMIGMLNIF